MKSFKHERVSFLFTFLHVQSTYIGISTTQTDLGQRSRTFSQLVD